MFHLEWIWILLLSPLPWLFRRLLPAARPPTANALFIPFASSLIQGELHHTTTATRMRIFATLCWFLLLSAACRPQWLGEPHELPQSGRNLMLAVDVSGSMEQTDMERGRLTRLDIVKQVASAFIQRREGDQIALILFGSQAYLQTPFTFDRFTVATLLEEAVIGIAGQETAIGDAIGMAIKKSHNQQGEQVLILLTDGANSTGAISPIKAATLAAQSGLRIHTIGIGNRRQATTSLFGLQLRNPALQLDEKTLQAIANTTGGHYFHADDRNSLESVYQQLDQLEPVDADSRLVRPVDELYPWPLALALILSMTMVFYRLGPIRHWRPPAHG